MSPTLTHATTCERYKTIGYDTLVMWRVVVGYIRAFAVHQVAGRRLQNQLCRRHYKAHSGFVGRKG